MPSSVLQALTEVHVPWLARRSRICPKTAFLAASSRLKSRQMRGFFKCKYQSKWCANPFALTIYVNADDLHFSPNDGQTFAPCLRKT